MAVLARRGYPRFVPYPPEHKPRTRERIVEAATRLFRESGYGATGIDALMAKAGLTRGGFYAHFREKAALFADTVALGFAESRANLLSNGLDDLRGRAWVEAATRRYLSAIHRERRDVGCVAAALASEVARAPRGVRKAFAEGAAALIDGMAARLGDDREARARAIGLLSTWIGALVLARAVPDGDLAEEILDAAKAASAQRT
jgi:AcrR family transcriptional regulator